MRPLRSSSCDEVRDWVIEKLKATKGGQAYTQIQAEEIANSFAKHHIDGQCFREMTVKSCLALGIPYGSAMELMRGSQNKSMTFDDWEGLFKNSMMIAAVLLSFAVTLHTGSKTLDDFTEADERRFRLFKSGNSLNTMQYYDVTSYRTNLHGCQAVSYFTLILILGYSSSISLYVSTARHDPEFLAVLTSPLKLVLGVCFGLMLAGLHSLFLLNWSLVDVIYPIYNGDVPVGQWYDQESGSIIEALDVSGFTWVTQDVVNVMVSRLTACFLGLPVIIISGTFILYRFYAARAKTDLQMMIEVMNKLSGKLDPPRSGVVHNNSDTATAGIVM